MERRVLKLEVIERNAGAVRFKIARQSHRMEEFANSPDVVYGFVFNGFEIRSITRPSAGGLRSGTLFVRGNETKCDNKEMIASEELYDKKIVPAVKAYNDTNGGFGFDDDVCPTCGQEIKDWKPRLGEFYFYFDSDGLVERTKKEGYEEDDERVGIGNAFKTAELAQIAAQKVKEVLRGAKHG